MIERLWLWLTEKVLGDEWIVSTSGYVCLDARRADPETLTEVFDLPAFRDPVDELHTLPDEKGRIYVWTTETEREREQVLRWFGESNADPEALHFVLCELEELREIDEQELKPYLGGLN